jgi:hypothetical protein
MSKQSWIPGSVSPLLWLAPLPFALAMCLPLDFSRSTTAPAGFDRVAVAPEQVQPPADAASAAWPSH